MESFSLNITFFMPDFQNGKGKRNFVKSIILEVQKRYNKNVENLGDWPLIIQAEEDSAEGLCSLLFKKALEPDENPENTMNDIIAFVRKDLALSVYNIERSFIN